MHQTNKFAHVLKDVERHYKYTYPVSFMSNNGSVLWCAKVTQYKHVSYHKTEHAAALAADICLIKHGKKPVNVLIKK